MTVMPQPQTFEEAFTRFQELLTQNGYSANLVWVEPGDLVLPGSRSIYVKLPISTRNLARARDRFEHGMSKGLGVVFGTICELPNATPCYAWVPNDEIDQQQNHLMCRGLKVSAKTGSSRVPGVIVRSRLHWWLLNLRHRRHSSLRAHLFG